MRNRQMIVRWLMANTKAIDVRQRDGKTFYVMTDAKAFREGVGRLLGEVQRIKSEGDYAAAKALFEAHGVHFDPKLRDEVVARVDRLQLPSYSGFVMPKLDRGHRRQRRDHRRDHLLPDGPDRADARVLEGVGGDSVNTRTYRAGQAVEDHCRACHEDRMHTVVVVDQAQQPLRVTCDFCGSEHNYRGGARTPTGGPPSPASRGTASTPSASVSRSSASGAPALPLVSDRELLEPSMSESSVPANLELLLRRIIREESGLTPAAPAEKWRGGDLVLRPGQPGVQEKSWPIETFFHKIVMLRNRLRTLEQQVNASELPDDQKVKLQSYITGCYGSLTSFNVLFADEDDRFVGAASD